MQWSIIFLSFFISACATATGPQIRSDEESRARAALLAEAQAWQKKQQQKISEIGARLVKASGNEYPLKFHFVGDPDQSGGRIHPDLVNAWTDGESVWITRGMTRFLKSDDELGVVLAHEMAHAYRGHMDYLRAKQLLGLAVGIPAAVFGGRAAGDLAMLTVDAATKKFDRDQEREADLYGLIWAHKAGFNIDMVKDVFRRMAIEMPESMEQGFLSSHPTSVERFLAMDKIAEALKEGLDPLKVFAPPGSKKSERK